MEVKLEFTEEELAELVSSIQNAPVGGFGRIDKNRDVYSLPTKKLANKVAQKINSALGQITAAAVKEAKERAESVAEDKAEEVLADKVSKSGDTMPGPLTMQGANSSAIYTGDEIAVVPPGGENITVMRFPNKNGTIALDADVTEAQTRISLLNFTVNSGVAATGQLSLDDNYVLKLQLFAKDGTVLSTTQVDFPVESVVVNGAYDDENKQIVLTLQNGNTVNIPVGDLINGLISSTEKGQPNGVAMLDEEGNVPTSQLGNALTKNDSGQYYIFAQDESIRSDEGGAGQDITIDYTGFYTRKWGGVVNAKYTSDGIKFNAGDRYDEFGIVNVHFKFPYKTADDTFAMLSDAADLVKVGLTTNTETLTYTEKDSACDWLGAVRFSETYHQIGSEWYRNVFSASSISIARWIAGSSGSPPHFLDYDEILITPNGFKVGNYSTGGAKGYETVYEDGRIVRRYFDPIPTNEEEIFLLPKASGRLATEEQFIGIPQKAGWKVINTAMNHIFLFDSGGVSHNGFASFVEYENLADTSKHMITADIHETNGEDITNPEDFKVITVTLGTKWTSAGALVNAFFPYEFKDATKYTHMTVDKYSWIMDQTEGSVGLLDGVGTVIPQVYAIRDANGYNASLWGLAVELTKTNSGKALHIDGKHIQLTFYDYHTVTDQ